MVVVVLVLLRHDSERNSCANCERRYEPDYIAPSTVSTIESRHDPSRGFETELCVVLIAKRLGRDRYGRTVRVRKEKAWGQKSRNISRCRQLSGGCDRCIFKDRFFARGKSGFACSCLCNDARAPLL